MSKISIWPIHKSWLSTWWQNPCRQSQRSDISCSWPPGLHTSQDWDFVPLLFSDPQVIKVSRLMFGSSNLQLLHVFSTGLRYRDWLGHSRTLMCFFLSHSFVALAVCFGSLSCWKPIHDLFSMPWLTSMPWPWRYMAPSIVPLMRCSWPVPLAEKHPKAKCFHLYV